MAWLSVYSDIVQHNSNCLIVFQFLKYLLYQRMSVSGSQIIATFIETKQEMQLQADKRNFQQFTTHIKKRSIKVKKDLQSKEVSFNKAIELAEKFKSISIHKIPLEQFQAEIKTDLKLGLTSVQAERRLAADGFNKLSEKKGTHWTLLLLKQLFTPFSVVLWIGAILCFLATAFGDDPSNLYVGISLVVVVSITGILTFYQSLKSQAILQSFKDFIPPSTIVIRDGAQTKLDANKLVVGDVVRIQTGKKIPADVRIIQSVGMKVDNSSLTGQTELLVRSPKYTDDDPLQTKNIAFFSTLAKEGTGIGVVFATGDRTFIGQIANLAANASDTEETPLQNEIQRFIFRLTVFSVIVGALLFGFGFYIGYSPASSFTVAIGVITANVPEGLIVEITVGLTLTAQILSRRKVLVKYLDAVETLGATSCICSDKTGTLTMNKMTASNIWYSGKLCKAENYQKKGVNHQYQYNQNEIGFQALQEVAVVGSIANFDKSLPAEQINNINNDDRFTKEQKDQKIKDANIQWEQKLKNMLYLDMPTTGDASQSGLIKFFQPLGDIYEIRKRFKVVTCLVQGEETACRVPFDSAKKYAFSINHYETEDSHFATFLKGAPQQIWENCKYIDINGKPQPITAVWKESFRKANEKFGKNGERVLGFAKAHLPKIKYPKDHNFNVQKDDVLINLTFVGMLSLTDPPRDSVPYAVIKCKSAGVKVIMVTGDQPATAASIARQCNIITEQTVNQISQRTGRTFDQCFNESDAIVIHGKDLTQMSREDQGLPQSQQGKKLEKWLRKSQIVFARTSPAQKLIIVKCCQKLGQVVAVTGDGVNDSPAIKKADIGVSMGITGTDVAKDAADMILLNDDFSSIVVGIEQGRKIYDNIKKSICYSLSSQIGQMVPFIVFIAFQIPAPLSSILVMYISIGTDLIPAIALAYEPAQIDLMTRKPRNKQDHMVNITLIAQSYGYIGWSEFWGGLLCFYVTMNDFGFPPSQLFMKSRIIMFYSNPGDVYNPTNKFFGNSYLQSSYSTTCPPTTDGIDQRVKFVDWATVFNADYDLRNTVLKCSIVGGQSVYEQAIKWGSCNVQQISPITNLPVCFTSEAAKYAQTAYFIGVVWGQMLNYFVCKSTRLSCLTQGVSNAFMFFALTTQVLLVILVSYFIPFNYAFQTRDVTFMHFGIASIPFCILSFVIDEIRKYLIRNLPFDDKGKPHWFARAAYW